MVNLPVKMSVSFSSGGVCWCSWLPCVVIGAAKTNQTRKFSRDDSAVILSGGLDPQSPWAV